MKFTVAALSFVGLVAALPQASESASITSAPAAPSSSVSISIDPVYSSVLSCISACTPGDVMCQAKCQGLPTPDEGAVNATHDCIAACPPGGDDEKNAAWAVCQQKCVTELYWTATQRGSIALPTDAAATDSNGGDATQTGSDGPAETGSESSGTSTEENPSETSGGSNPSQSPNSGSSMLVNLPLLGALFLGVLAL